MGMSDHTNPVMLNDEWLTPPYIIEALGRFDLDPCSPINRPWDTATIHYGEAARTIKNNNKWLTSSPLDLNCYEV